MPKKGLEPPHPCEYVDLNHARLPIPPLRHDPSSARGAERAAILILATGEPGVKLREQAVVGQFEEAFLPGLKPTSISPGCAGVETPASLRKDLLCASFRDLLCASF